MTAADIEKLKADYQLRLELAKLVPEIVSIKMWHSQTAGDVANFYWKTGHEITKNEWGAVCDIIVNNFKDKYSKRSVKNYYRYYELYLMEICNPNVKLFDNGTYLGDWNHALNTGTATWEQKAAAIIKTYKLINV